MGDVTLRVDGKKFKVEKDTLCEYSDYFRAMFSGNYAESDKQEISIDMVDAESMETIVQYMRVGLIDLSEFSLSTIGELATAANFLQITELIKQIEYTLELQIALSNWLEITSIAENSSFKKLEQYTVAFGLLSFKKMQTQVFTNIKKLHWYLSHPFLDADSELDVFKFGLKWIQENETGADALLIVLSCLSLTKLSRIDIEEMLTLIKDFKNSLAAKVIECLCKLHESISEISKEVVIKCRNYLCENYSERVYNEVFTLVKESRVRELVYTPTVPMWIMKENRTVPEVVPHFMYTFDAEKGFQPWLEVAEKSLWGWSVASWGPTKLVMVCGEHGRGTGIFMKDVKVYDILKKEWSNHGVQLPPRRHGGVAVVDDSLFLLGGVGGFRSVFKLWRDRVLQVVLDTGIIYNLKERTYRKIAKLPDTIQNPAVCVHKGQVYSAGHKNIYKYEEFGDRDIWSTVLTTDFRINCMISYKDYVYCIQNYYNHLYRFKPLGFDNQCLELITCFTNSPALMCNLGNRLLVFTQTMCGQTDELTVEEYSARDGEEKPKVLWTETGSELRVHDVAGSCSFVLFAPPLNPGVSCYAQQYLKRY